MSRKKSSSETTTTKDARTSKKRHRRRFGDDDDTKNAQRPPSRRFLLLLIVVVVVVVVVGASRFKKRVREVKHHSKGWTFLDSKTLKFIPEKTTRKSTSEWFLMAPEETDDDEEEEEEEEHPPLLTASDVATVLNTCHENCVIALPPSCLVDQTKCGFGLFPNAKSAPGRTASSLWIGRVDQLANALGVVRFSKDASQEDTEETDDDERQRSSLDDALRNLRMTTTTTRRDRSTQKPTSTAASNAKPRTGENERDEELGSRSLYSFYVVLKAIHEMVTNAPEPSRTSAAAVLENNKDGSNSNLERKSNSNSASSNNNRSDGRTNSVNEASSGDGTTTTTTRTTPTEEMESSALKYMVVIPGSGGVAGDTLRYVRRFASMGHVVIAPDDMAWPTHLRNRARKDLREGDSAEDEINTTKEEENPYWNDLALYEAVTDAVTGAKQGASGSLVYKSSAKSFIENSFLKKQYDAALKLKSVVVSHILLTLPDFIKNAGVALVGNSEGAAVLGMLNDKTFMNNYATISSKSVVKARIAIAYPFEPSYFTDGLKGWFAGTFGSSWSSNCPVLCINGSEDEFFGPLASVASDVVSAKRMSLDGREKEVVVKNYSGDASIALEKLAAQHRAKNQGQSNLLSVIVVGAKHGILKSHDDMVSKLLRTFLRAPQKCLKSIVEAFREEVVDYTITSNGSVGKLILETKKSKSVELNSSLYDAAA